MGAGEEEGVSHRRDGFVSDRDVAPLKGLTVRLTDHKTKGAKAFTATVDAEGYFSIDLGTDKPTPRDSDAKPSPINLSKRRADLMAGPSHDRGAAPAASAEAGVGQVEILNAQGKVLHRDPTLVALNGGSMYRENVITGSELHLNTTLGNSWCRPNSPPSPGRSAIKDSAGASNPGIDVPASSAATSSAAKRSPGGVKSAQSKTEISKNGGV